MAQDTSLEPDIAVDDSSLSDDSSSVIDDTEVSGRVDEEFPGSLSENWEDNPSEMTSPNASMFPREEYLVIMDALHQLHGVFPVQHLITCLKACVCIQRHKKNNEDSTLSKRFLREALQLSFERCLRPDSLQRMTKLHLEFMLEGFMHVISLCAIQLKRLNLELVHGFGSPEVQEAETDLVPVLMCLGHLLEGSQHNLFAWNRDAELPKHAALLLNSKNALIDEVEDDGCTEEGQGRFFDPDQHQDHKWLRCCLKHFLKQGCLKGIKEVLEAPDKVSVLSLDWIMHMLKLVVQHMPTSFLVGMPELLAGLLDHLSSLIDRDQERLANFGRDRNYMHFSSVLQNATTILSKANSLPLADFMEVTLLQRKFIEAMLQSSNFNKLLSAVRECNYMLKRSRNARESDIGASLKSNNEWLACENVVKLMLRANLHQRQYAEQVLGILTLLTEEHCLKEEHLEMLWSLTEQEDTFETVKNNVYMILAEIASALEPEQLDLLFRKFQVNKGRSLSDTMRILDLLKRLAVSDSEAGHMADKLLGMMWDLIMHADAHPELLRSNAMQDVLRGYDDRGHRYLLQYVKRCLEQLRARHNLCSSLSLLRALLVLFPVRRTAKAGLGTRGDVVDCLLKEEHALEVLVANLKAIMQQAHVLREQHPKAEPNGEGFYSYQQILQEHLLTIEYLARHSDEDPFMPEDLVVQLWNAFLREGSTELETILGVNWFKSAVHNQLLTASTLEILLQQHAVQMPVEHVDIDWFKLFEMLFLEVNDHNEKLETHYYGDINDDEEDEAHFLKQDLQDDPGLSYLWRVGMECGNEEVAQAAQLMLAGLYHANTPAVEYTPKIQACLLKRCVDFIFGSCKALLGLGHQETVDWSSISNLQIKDQRPGTLLHLRVLNRALSLLLTFITAVQGRTMPPVPAHKASFAGTPCVLDCQFFANSHRFKVHTHSNEYIGFVRKKAAAEINSQPQGVRLTCAGQEWHNDSLLVASLELKTRQVVNVSTCQINNTYTKTWDPDYVEAWHARSPMWLLSKMEHIYDVLFLLADLPNSLHVRIAANELLNHMPTSMAIPSLLRAALSSSNPCAQLQGLLMPGTEQSGVLVSQPAKLLYTLQALHGVLFPIHENEEPEQPGVGMAVSDKQEDDTAAATAPAPVTALTSDATPAAAAPAPVIRDAFLTTGCLLLVCNTVQKACSQASIDPTYLHSISRLMVLMMGSIVKEMSAQATAEAQSDTESVQRPAKPEQAEQPESMQVPEESADKPPTPQPSPASQVCALASALNLQESEQAAKAALDQDRAALMVSFLIDLARQAGCLWGLPVSHSSMLDSAVSIVRDALGVLLGVLEQQPDSCAVFLKDSNTTVMAADLLLNTLSQNIRCSASDTLARICIDSNHPEAHEWLLRLLTSQRVRAARLGKHSYELFTLFHRTVDTVALSGTPAEFVLADELLHDEVQLLHKVPKVEDDDASLILEWRLKLVHNLVNLLDKHAVGTASEGGLVRLLLTEYLFPEAYLQSQYPRGVVPGARLHDVMTTCPCHSPSCRRVALELVSDLMVHSLANLKEGSELLHALHYSPCPEDELKWDQQPPALMRSTDGYVGLKNAGATCYMNSTLQQLFMQPKIRGLLLSAKPVDDRDKDDNLFHSVQVVFANLLLSRHGFYSPKGFWSAFKDYDGQPIDTREHQDVYEFFTRLQDQVDHHLRVSNQQPAIQAVTGGKFVQQIICRDVDYRSERMEDFYQISVEVRGKHSLERSLESYVQGELMEGDNAYYCEDIGRKVAAVKRSCIKELPDTLVIHLKRFEFDHHTQSRFKVRDRFEFPLHLDMFKYTAEGLAAAEGGGRSTPTPPRPASYYKYELKGVIVHSGSAFTGHYYSYIKERNRRAPTGKVLEGRWFCFDDKLVKPWDVSTLEQDCYGGLLSQDYGAAVRLKHGQDMERPHSAYMLFYDRAEQGPLDEVDCLQEMALSRHLACSSSSGMQPPADVTMSTTPDSAMRVPLAHLVPHGYKTPYNLPHDIYESVMQGNIRYLYRLHLLDKEYFRFVRTIVEAKWEVGNSRKSRRTNQNTSNSQHSSISEGADGESTVLSRRGEDTYLAARICTRLAFHFMLKVYLTSHIQLRVDAACWQDVLLHLMNSNHSVVRVLLECFLEEISVLRCYLHNCALKAVREMIVWLIVTVIQRAFTISTPAPSTPASPSNLDASMPAQQTNPSASPSTVSKTVGGRATDMEGVTVDKPADVRLGSVASGSGATPPRVPVGTGETISSGLAGSCAALVHSLMEELVKMYRHALVTATPSAMQVEVHALVEILMEYCKLGPGAVTALASMDVLQISIQLARRLNDMQANGEDYWGEELLIISRLVYHMIKPCGDLLEVWQGEQVGITPCPFLTGELRCEDLFPMTSLNMLTDEALLRELMPMMITLAEEDCMHLASILTWNNGPRSMDLIRETLEFLESGQDTELEAVLESIKKLLLIRDDLHQARVRMVLLGMPNDPDQPCMMALLSHPHPAPVRLLLLLKLTLGMADASPTVRKMLSEVKLARGYGPVKPLFDAIAGCLQRLDTAMVNPAPKNLEALQRLYENILALGNRLHQIVMG